MKFDWAMKCKTLRKTNLLYDFSTFKLSSLHPNQSDNILISCSILSHSSFVDKVKYDKAVSSAKAELWAFNKPDYKSLTLIKSNIGPRADPWGMRHFISCTKLSDVL